MSKQLVITNLIDSMQEKFSDLVSRYDELTDAERSRLSKLARTEDERRLLDFVAKLFDSLADDPTLANDGTIRRAELTELVVNAHFSSDVEQEAIRNQLARLIEGRPALEALVSEQFSRLETFDRELPAEEHFARLTGTTVREPLPRAFSSPGGVSRPIPKRTAFGSRVRPRTVSLVAACVVVVAIAFSMFVSGRPDAALRFIRTDVLDGSIGAVVRGFPEAGEAQSSSVFRQRLGAAVLEMEDDPFAATSALHRLNGDLARAAAEAESDSARSELLFVSASASWALGATDSATVAFKRVVELQGRQAASAERALRELAK